MKRTQLDLFPQASGARRGLRVASCFALASLLTMAVDVRASMIFESGTTETFSGTVVGNTLVRDSVGGDATDVTLDGGDLQGQVIVRDASVLRIDSGFVGSVTGDLLLADDALLEVDGGTFFVAGLPAQSLQATGSSTAVIRGGLFNGLVGADDDSEIEIRGGTFGLNLLATANGVLTVYGQGFELDGIPVGPGPLTADGTLTGTLQFNVPIDNAVSRLNNGQIIIVETPIIPEPTTATLLAALAASGLTARRR